MSDIPPILRGVQIDNPDTLAQCLRSDLIFLKLEASIPDEKDRKLTEQVFREHYEIIKKIHGYVKSQSAVYPQVDQQTLNTHFYEKLNLPSM